MRKPTLDETKAILRRYSRIEIELKNIQYAIQQKPNADEIIYSAFSGHPISDMPRSMSGVSDKTADTAMTYVRKMEIENQALQDQLKLLRNAKYQIDMAMQLLTDNEKLVFCPRYLDGKVWSSIVDSLPDNYDIHTEKSIRMRCVSLLKIISLSLCFSEDEIRSLTSYAGEGGL